MNTPSDTVQAAQPAFPHYFKPIPPGCTHVDVYRVLQLFEVADPALQHAAKKLLCAGARGAKDQAQDVAEAIATLQRWQQMRAEEQDASDLRDAVDQMREVMGRYCECRARLAGDCPGTWEPGCDMGANEAHAAAAPAETGERLDAALGIDRDPDRAAYLARWANAPEWAQWLAQDGDGWCFWFSGKPYQHEILGWCIGHPGQNKTAGDNLLGRVACEPRPTPAVDPERAAYLQRWANAPAEANWLCETFNGANYWCDRRPNRLHQYWTGAAFTPAGDGMLGSVRCEPRPTPAGGQGVGP
jgi:hypothetical protein